MASQSGELARVRALALIASTLAPTTFGCVSDLLSGPSDARFVPDRGPLLPIDLNGSVPLQEGLRGVLKAEVDFASDLVDAQGAFSMRSARAFWRVFDGQGRQVVVRGLGEGVHAWNGVESPVEVKVNSFDRTSGVCKATLELPVGGHDLRAFGTGGGTTWTQTFSAWCCKYDYAGTGSSNVPGVSRAVCGNL